MLDMENERFIRISKALGDDTRLRIVQFLSNCCCGCGTGEDESELNACLCVSESPVPSTGASSRLSHPTAGEVCCQINGNPKISSTVSHHLHELEGAELITLQKQGKSVCCALNRGTLQDMASQLLQLANEDQSSCCQSSNRQKSACC